MLDQIRQIYGPQNDEQSTFFSDADEAVIVVKDRAGARGLFVVLTNLAAMYADGSIESLDELREEWLTPPNQ